jgi:hypothetical protein
VFVAAAQAGAVEVRTTVLVRTGDPVPGLGPAYTWQALLTGITDHAISEAGHVVFSGVIAGPDVDETNSVVLAAGPIGGPYRLIARGGTPAPGAPAGVNFSQPALGFLSDNGRVMFFSTVVGPGITISNDAGLWMESDPPGGTPLPVIQEGMPAPGFPGLTISTFDPRALSFQPRFGVIAMPATLTGPGVTTGNASVLYQSEISSPSVLLPLARAGDLIPTQVGISYGTFGLVSHAGGPNSIDLIVRNTLVAPGITTSNDGAFLLFQPGNSGPGVVIREGSPIPGQPVGTYNQLLSPIALVTGEIGYFATATGITTPNGTTWIGSRSGQSGGSPRPLALRDTPAPGFPAGSTMVSAVIDRFDVTSTGRAAYAATCSGTGVTTANDTALFSEGPNGVGAPVLLAREGSPATGLPAPAVFQAMGSIYNSAAINARHQTAFFAYAPGIGTPDVAADTGLWVADTSGAVQLVAHKAMPFALGPGDVRTPSVVGYRVLYTRPQPASRKWFLDDGRLLTSMIFTDQTSALLLLHVDPPVLCRADFNNDGDDTLQDLFDYLGAWFAQQPTADIDGQGGVTVLDLFEFLAAWFAGCP